MRPIDADAIPYTMLYKEDWIKGIGQEKQGAWKEDIDKMPTIEPKCADGCLYGFGSDECERCLFTTVKPKRGHWIITDAYPHNVYCSECYTRFAQTHWAVWEDGSLPRNYCPNCGARMEEQNNE